MIHEVDEALRALFRAEAVHGGQVAVVFDAPTRDWAGTINAPTINLYLYDIREDLRRRERGLYNTYDDQGVIVARRRPPRYFKLSYLITAWTRRPEDEHRLLSSLLSCLLRHEAIPDERLTGSLAELGISVPMTVALPPPEDRSFADVWTALGGELKPSIDLVVSVPVTESPIYPAGPPVTDEGVQLGFSELTPEEPTAPAQATPGGTSLPLYGRIRRPNVNPSHPSGEPNHAPGSAELTRRAGIASHVAEEPAHDQHP